MSRKLMPQSLQIMGLGVIAYGIYLAYHDLRIVFIIIKYHYTDLPFSIILWRIIYLCRTILSLMCGKVLLNGKKDTPEKFKIYGGIVIFIYTLPVIFRLISGDYLPHSYYFRMIRVIAGYIGILLMLNKNDLIKDYFKNKGKKQVRRNKFVIEKTENQNITEEKKEVSKISDTIYEETAVLHESNLKEEKRHNENKNSEEDDIKRYQLKNGVIRSYYENGALRIEENYVNNILEGQAVEYHSTGRIKSRGLYSNGNKIGKWKYYDEKGVPLEDEEY